MSIFFWLYAAAMLLLAGGLLLIAGVLLRIGLATLLMDPAEYEQIMRDERDRRRLAIYVRSRNPAFFRR